MYDLHPLKSLISGLIVSIRYPFDIDDDMFKGTRNAHQNALKLLRQAQKLGLALQINWVMDSLNKHNFPEMVKITKEFDADLNILKFIDYDDDFQRRISLKEFEEISLLAKKYGGKIKAKVNVFFPCKWSSGYSCTFGINRAKLDVLGNFHGCIYSAQSHGNLLKEGYKKVEERMNEYIVKNYIKRKCLVEEKINNQRAKTEDKLANLIKKR